MTTVQYNRLLALVKQVSKMAFNIAEGEYKDGYKKGVADFRKQLVALKRKLKKEGKI